MVNLYVGITDYGWFRHHTPRSREKERALRSTRTRAAFAAKRPQGVKLGNPSNIGEAAQKGREAQRVAADQFAANVLPVIETIEAAGATSLDAMEKALGARGMRTVRGGRWHSTTLRNLAGSERAFAEG